MAEPAASSADKSPRGLIQSEGIPGSVLKLRNLGAQLVVRGIRVFSEAFRRLRQLEAKTSADSLLGLLDGALREFECQLSGVLGVSSYKVPLADDGGGIPF